jgi:threonyl-tRNA synthetase
MYNHDHRVLGPRLDLFHQQDEAPGNVFWHPRGMTLYRLIENYIRDEMRLASFQEVRTPQLVARSLWERSGHWAKFGANMFVFEDGERSYALKPMNCPGHIQLFRQQVRSYRDLPLRFSEFGACHRYEPSGALHGLMRGRAFTQDDAHVFCTRPASREGSDAVWDQAEAQLSNAARKAGLEFRVQPGEGAFYGPKLEFILQDRDQREWQCGTIQLDLVLPEKLDAQIIDASGAAIRPLMIHHAVLGSIERFMAVLLEHHRGQLPLWLAPTQAVIAPLTTAEDGYARSIADLFEAANLRCIVDASNETLSRRVVAAHELGIPVFVTVGPREVAGNSVALREHGKQSSCSATEAIARLSAMTTNAVR